MQESIFMRKEKRVYEKRDWHKCFPVKFEKFLRTPFCIEDLRWLLLYILRRGLLDSKLQWYDIVKNKMSKEGGLIIIYV